MSTTDEKADTFLRMIRSSQRGRLKVYLGYCAGVGKTCQMLAEGNRLKREGVDVVVGLLETHGRAETARLAEGLEVVPRVRHEYRGVALEEMDAAAVMARKPEVVLVDELAHTNVPGSANRKRYEDVQDILSAGIHVITTLNVQHLESLYDTVESLLGVRVRERLPDSVLAEADQIVNVDITVEDLRERLAQGKIYPEERAAGALDNFFVKSNLDQLREITLRELASQIDFRQRMPAQQDQPQTPDQVVVCLSSAGPGAEKLLRYASRLAGRLNRNWYALYVQTPSEDPDAMDARTHEALSGALSLAKQLGAMIFTYKGNDVAETILGFAREYRAGHIVVGSPAPLSWWRRIQGRRTIVERLISGAEGQTIVVFDTAKALKTPFAETAQRAGTKRSAPSPSVPSLSALLSPDCVILWDEPVLREEVLNVLAKAALGADLQAALPEVSQKLREREELGSTFFNEGIAFPHARMNRLPEPRIAVGVSRHGVADVLTARPVELVFLILSPAESPTAQLQLLALVSRAGQNRQFRAALKTAFSPGDVINAILRWEAQNETLGL